MTMFAPRLVAINIPDIETQKMGRRDVQNSRAL